MTAERLSCAHPHIAEANSQPVQSTDDSCCIGRNRAREVVGNCLQDEIQEFLAYASKVRVPVPDLACGVVREDLPDVTKIPLINTADEFALIDTEDYPLVQRYRWYRMPGERYAYASVSEGGKSRHVLMHRLILMIGRSSLEVDHRSGNGLDNRKHNLRGCTGSQNGWNAVLSAGNTSGVKGVSFHKRSGTWVASIAVNKKRYTKHFSSVERAASWIKAKRAELHGEFARHE